MITRITGKDNKTIKFIKSLKKKSNRTENNKFVAEGRRIVLEAFEYAKGSIYCVVATQDFVRSEPEIIEKATSVCDKVYEVPSNVFEDISDTDTPQGILAVIEIRPEDFSVDGSVGEIAVLDGVSEPGNMGTVIRTAEALGFGGIYFMKGCADIYSQKTVRATMGSIFRMKFRSGCTVQDIRELKEKGFSVISTTPGGDVCLETLKVPKRCAVVIGNEAHGVCDEILELSDMRVRISMGGLAESLNAAVAAGIAMHWIKNCRQ